MRNDTCQNNKLIYFLGCNLCNSQYVGQTRNRIMDRFQGDIFSIKHIPKQYSGQAFSQPQRSNKPQDDYTHPEYIKLLKGIPRSNSFRDQREFIWIHRLNT